MRRWVVAISGVLFVWSGAAWAGGFEHNDNGTVAEGRGGAFTARASDGSAFHYNPAGLAGQRGTNIMVLSNLTNLHACFTRSGDYPGGYGLPASPPTPYSAAGPMCDFHGFFDGLGPMITLSTDLGNPKLPVFGIGLWGPSAMLETGYSQNGEDRANPSLVTFQDGDRTRATWAPNRFDLVDNRLVVIYISPTIAYEPVPGLRLGAQFQWVYASFEFTNYGAVSLAEPTGQTVRNHLVASDPFTPAFQLGAQYALGRNLQFGALFRWAGAFDSSGDLELTAVDIDRTDPANPKELEQGSGTVAAHLKVNMPASLRLAARFLLPRGRGPNEQTTDEVGHARAWDAMVDEVFDVEFDWVYETNSTIQNFVISSNDMIQLKDANGDVFLAADPVGKMSLVHGYQDTHSFRLGGDWNLIQGRLAARLGLAYETATVPVNNTLLDFPAFARFSTHVGATVRLGPADISLAYAHIFQGSRDVKDGAGRVAGPGGVCDPSALEPGRAAACVTNNGHYEASYDVISLGVQARF
jgi:long-chain fatty acid transport protein